MPCPLCHNTINGRKLGFSLKKKTFRTIFPERIPPGIVSSKSAEIGWKALGNLISTRTDLCNQSFNERHTSWKEFFLNFDFINVLHHTGFWGVYQIWGGLLHISIMAHQALQNLFIKSKVLRNWCLPKYEIPIARFLEIYST